MNKKKNTHTHIWKKQHFQGDKQMTFKTLISIFCFYIFILSHDSFFSSL